MKPTHKFLGTEFDWLATDLDGHVAMFSTGGRGPIPGLLASSGTYLDCVLERILALHIRGDAPTVLSYPRDWFEVARRGLFAYDWKWNSNLYEIEARPLVPLTVGEIEDVEVRDITSRVQLPIRFASAKFISPDLDASPASP